MGVGFSVSDRLAAEFSLLTAEPLQLLLHIRDKSLAHNTVPNSST
jgi:hypothetical protein